MVGDRKWERWMASFCKPFTDARVKYFENTEVDAAWKWLQENEEESAEGSDRPPRVSDKTDMGNIFPWYGF
jgi:hypothetical protein